MRIRQQSSHLLLDGSLFLITQPCKPARYCIKQHSCALADRVRGSVYSLETAAVRGIESSANHLNSITPGGYLPCKAPPAMPQRPFQPKIVVPIRGRLTRACISRRERWL